MLSWQAQQRNHYVLEREAVKESKKAAFGSPAAFRSPA
jgi:hypothetical protein